MNKLCIALLLIFSVASTAFPQRKVYFVDGYHGGIYGHYPVEWKTQFLVDQLAKHPEWRIELEIEPETWDTVQVRTPEAYAHFKEALKGGRIEFANPSYAQPYCYNISGESLIRQFQYGMRTIRRHFPNAQFLTYSVEEPCFTSCLPQILLQLGFKYAVLKCTNTCWGGYSAPYGKELVNWIGPDGSSILTVPRYACEELLPKSTWQTTAWGNDRSYLDACFAAGIAHPVGMCFQDAGWKNGPWLGSGNRIKNNSIYVLWRDYFANVSNGKTDDDYHFSQEDVRVNLMWGSQVMQRLARQVRTAENKMVRAEKLGFMAHVATGFEYSQADMDEAWRTLMLAQHHDSWIVPYNGLHGKGTWADAIERWTSSSNRTADNVALQAMLQFGGSSDLQVKGNNSDVCNIRLCNTLGSKRKEVVKVLLPREYANAALTLTDSRNKKVNFVAEDDGKWVNLYFEAEVPSFGYTTYCVRKSGAKEVAASAPKVVEGDEYTLENDMYRLVFDLTRGGVLKSLVAKKEGNKEFVDADSEYAWGELRGFFYEEGRFRSSTETPARLTVLCDNEYTKQVRIEGEIASHPFVQTLTLAKGEPRIDCELDINWKHNVGIGEYEEKDWAGRRRAYCDDRFKLSILFPTDLQPARIYKNAPFDVCESKLDNTFFNRWDEIKHNIILNWVDLKEEKGNYALALLSDHTTSYSYGDGYPLGLTVQYSGGGLWGRNYKIDGPSKIRFALVPHRGMWDKAGIAHCSEEWNEPCTQLLSSSSVVASKSFINLHESGYQLSTANLEGVEEGKIMVRLFNATGDGSTQRVTFNFPLAAVEEVDLNGKTVEKKKIKSGNGRTEVELSMPRFGVRTYCLHLK